LSVSRRIAGSRLLTHSKAQLPHLVNFWEARQFVDDARPCLGASTKHHLAIPNYF
jgi:hypothetical protein